MPRKNKPRPFTAAKAVKAMARHAVGSPPPVQREESRKNDKPRKEKHRMTLEKLLSDRDSR